MCIFCTVLFFLALPWKSTTAEHIMPIEIKYPTDPQALVTYYAKRYKVSEKTMRAVIKCESGWNTKAINNSKIEYSAGLVQINLRAHKNITLAQAQDPNFAIRFLASNLAKGNGRIWTCYRNLV